MKYILFLNHKQRQCGVYQYGKRTFDILKSSSKYRFVYAEVESVDEYKSVESNVHPKGIIYNYHNLTMAWLGGEHLDRSIKHFGIHHEGSKPTQVGFNYYLHADCTVQENERDFAIPRPLIEGIETPKVVNKIPTIGSFGFGFGHKNFGSVVKAVNDEFDEAIIRLHMPRAYYGDRNGEATAGVIPGCQAEVHKEGIKLIITHNFLDDIGLLSFLNSNDINAFLYSETYNTGLSSVIDYALSVDKPIMVNKTSMFRHINWVEPSICHGERTIRELMSDDNWQLEQFKEAWSNSNFIDKYESIIDRCI